MTYTRTLVSCFAADHLCHARVAQKPAVENAWQLIAQGKQDQALALLRNLIHSEPRNADARLLLGSILMEEGQRSESIAQLDGGRSPASEIRRGAQRAGRSLQHLRRTRRGASGVRARAWLDPRHAQAHVSLAAFCSSRATRKPRSRTWTRPSACLGASRTPPIPAYLRAKVYSEERDFAKAASELQQAVELRPEFAEAWSDLGEARKNLNDGKGALAAFRRAVALSPEDAVARAASARQLLDAGAAHEAADHLEAGRPPRPQKPVGAQCPAAGAQAGRPGGTGRDREEEACRGASRAGRGRPETRRRQSN